MALSSEAEGVEEANGMKIVTNSTDNVLVPETKVLAVASHVVYGYVGNTMATFCMQVLGCEVAALNTVHFSNHTGYKQWKGTRTSPEQIKDLYMGLQQSHLMDFDVMLSGYIPSAAALHEVATIARDLRNRNNTRPGGFFWILDPVMGDQGRLYVSEELVEGYRNVIKEADLVVPNQFELQLISDIKIGTEVESLAKVRDAIEVLHKEDGVPHVIVTSVRVKDKHGVLCVVGSSKKQDGSSRCFVIEVPVLNCYFSGTGDMFAGLMVGRLREACQSAGVLGEPSWISPDEVSPTELPLAKATEKVLSSMNLVLGKTMKARNEEIQKWGQNVSGSSTVIADGAHNKDDEPKRRFLAETKAAEVKAVRNAEDLLRPDHRYTAFELKD